MNRELVGKIERFVARHNIDQSVAEALEAYVYVLSDPENKIPLYVGKGRGARVLSHFYEAIFNAETHKKIQAIKEIFVAGNEPTMEIIRYGLSDEEAFLVEAVVIDVIGMDVLTNRISGHGSNEKGRKRLDELVWELKAEEAVFEKPTLLIKINRQWPSVRCDGDKIYESTRKAWRLNPTRASQCTYVCAVAFGLIREVYEEAIWSMCRTGAQGEDLSGSRRYEFTGRRATSQSARELIGKSVAHLMAQGAQNPIAYVVPKKNLMLQV